MNKHQFDNLIGIDIINLMNKHKVPTECLAGLTYDIKGLVEYYMALGPIDNLAAGPQPVQSQPVLKHGQARTTTSNPYDANFLI